MSVSCNTCVQHDVRRACTFQGSSGVEVKDKDETHTHACKTLTHTEYTHMRATYARDARKLLTHATHATLCTLSVACVRGVHGIRVRACVVCMRGIRAWLACVF